MPEAENWTPIAQTLGFVDERDMLINLYTMQNFSLSQMEDILGFSTWSVRRRLVIWGIPLRGRGGPNNRIGRRRLKHLSDEELKQSAPALAAKYQVHVSTVYAEIRFRAKEKVDEILSNHAGGSFEPLRQLEHQLDGTSSAPAHSSLPEILPGESASGPDSNPGQRSLRGSSDAGVEAEQLGERAETDSADSA